MHQRATGTCLSVKSNSCRCNTDTNIHISRRNIWSHTHYQGQVRVGLFRQRIGVDWSGFLLPALPVTLIGMIQEETEFESTFVLFSDGGSFSLDQFVCLVWDEEALGAGAEAFALWPPVTSTTSLSSVEVA